MSPTTYSIFLLTVLPYWGKIATWRQSSEVAPFHRMSSKDQSRIRQEARKLLLSLWEQRNQIWTQPPDAEGLIPVPLDVVVRQLLNLSLEEPEEIRLTNSGDGYEVAGFLDRLLGRIVISQKYPNEFRRFTLAHEIAHWVLHPEEAYHRDRPLTGGERANNGRSVIEQEADMFAGELLMPEKQLRRRFEQVFGERFDGRSVAAAARFSAGTRRPVNEIQFSTNRRYRAMKLAEATSFGGRYFTPLSSAFEVSPTAMAIQLEILGLVV